MPVIQLVVQRAFESLAPHFAGFGDGFNQTGVAWRNCRQAHPFRPVGFWAKLLDQRLEQSLDQALSRFELSRRHWQLLNVLSCGPHSMESVATEHAAFLQHDESATELVAGAVSQGLVHAVAGTIALSDAGRDRLEAAAGVVRAARSRVSDGVERSDYEPTVAVLETMCRNLGWTSET
jgi:hypothetical protein